METIHEKKKKIGRNREGEGRERNSVTGRKKERIVLERKKERKK